MSRLSALVLLAAVPFALAACHHAPPAATVTQPAPATAPTPTRRLTPPPPAATASIPAPLGDDELFRRKSLADLNAEHPLADVFFAYNENTLTDSARSDLERNAAWLKKWPQTRIAVDGHCDERGTAEYNLGLGARRAQVVRDYLNTLGVGADRIQTRSLGKEAPFCSGEGEGCWSQNRLDHFLITAK
jgi:peptidoglycan-associated lipoprotein